MWAEWARRFAWQQRAAEWDAAVDRSVLDRTVDTRAESLEAARELDRMVLDLLTARVRTIRPEDLTPALLPRYMQAYARFRQALEASSATEAPRDAALAVLDGRPDLLSADDAAFARERLGLAAGAPLPTEQALEAWLVCGRRAGKSHIAAMVAVANATRPYPQLAAGQPPTVALLARNVAQDPGEGTEELRRGPVPRTVAVASGGVDQRDDGTAGNGGSHPDFADNRGHGARPDTGRGGVRRDRVLGHRRGERVPRHRRARSAAPGAR